MRQLRFALNCQDTVRTSLHRSSSSSVKRRYRSSSCIAESPNGLVQLRDLRRHQSARDPQFKYHVDGSDRFSDYDCRDSLATWVGPDTFICTGPASTAYYNAICLRTNLSAIFTSGCPRNENGWRSGRVQTHRFTVTKHATVRLSVDVSPVEIDAIIPVLRAKANLKQEPQLNMVTHRK